MRRKKPKTIEQERHAELDRLELLYQECVRRVQEEDRPLQAMRIIVSLSERKAKLLGLDAKVEAHHQVEPLFTPQFQQAMLANSEARKLALQLEEVCFKSQCNLNLPSKAQSDPAQT